MWAMRHRRVGRQAAAPRPSASRDPSLRAGGRRRRIRHRRARGSRRTSASPTARSPRAFARLGRRRARASPPSCSTTTWLAHSSECRARSVMFECRDRGRCRSAPAPAARAGAARAKARDRRRPSGAHAGRSAVGGPGVVARPRMICTSATRRQEALPARRRVPVAVVRRRPAAGETMQTRGPGTVGQPSDAMLARAGATVAADARRPRRRARSPKRCANAVRRRWALRHRLVRRAMADAASKPASTRSRWELGHLAWFAEFWILRGPHAPRGRRLVARPCARRASPGPTRSSIRRGSPHADRWRAPMPSRAELGEMLQRQLDACIAALPRDAGRRRARNYFHRLALFHEDMHGEAFAWLRATLG